MGEEAVLLWRVFIFGVVGGLVSELLVLRGRIDWPHRTRADEITEGLEDAVARYVFDLGVLARLFVGGCAALVVLWMLGLDDDSLAAVVGGSILAGAAGGAVFQTLRGRLEAALATQKLIRTKAVVGDLAATVEQLAGATETVRREITSRSSSPAGGASYSFQADVALDLPDLESLDALVGKARALSSLALGGAGEVPRVGVMLVLADWARVPFGEVGPDSKPIASLWSQNPANPGLDPTHLGLLIDRLERRFPGGGLRLRPKDLGQGALATVGGLIVHVEQRVPRGRS